ncbi:MAG: exodeoxyribonuclease VII large subunit, partial [Candidatus Kapaibacterium sp.]
AEGRMRQSLRHRLSSYSQRSAALEERLRALYPLSPLRRGFALLKTPEGILSKDKSLAEFKKIEIIRENESARAKIEQILPRPLFD